MEKKSTWKCGIGALLLRGGTDGRTRLLGLAALNGASSSDAMFYSNTEFDRQISIIVPALLANIQLWATLLQKWGHPFLGTFSGNTPTSGVVAWIHPPDIVANIIHGTLQGIDIGHAFVYMLVMITGAVIFSIFWVQTAGMDAKSQARQMMASGLSVPGFRKDERVIESLLNRYIWPLTIMGAITVGFLSALADLSGALTSGTALLLTVMIIYKLYEEIAQQHVMDMNPMMRKFMEK